LEDFVNLLALYYTPKKAAKLRCEPIARKKGKKHLIIKIGEMCS